MYISAFEFENLRCFTGVHRVSLDRGDGSFAGWTVFAGRNGSGKTSLLQALVLGYVDLQTAHDLRPTAQHPWPRSDVKAARAFVERAKFDGTDRQDERRVFLNPMHSPDADPRLRDMTLLADWVSARSDGKDIYAVLVGDQRSLRVTPRDTPLFGYASLRIGPDREQAREMASDPLIARVEHLMSGGGPLSHAVAWLQDVHLRALEQRTGYAALREQVLAILNDGLLPDRSRVVRVDADGLWVERDGVVLPVKRVSDGYRVVVNLVLDILRMLHGCFGDLELSEIAGHMVCDLPAVVLIDEVDAHLHVAWQQEIGFWLTKRFPRIQFLVTTHSPFICQAASPKGLVRLPAPGDAKPIAHVSDATWTAVVNGTLDDAVLSSLFGLEDARSDRASAQLARLGALEFRVLEGKASETEVLEYDALRSHLGDSLRSAVYRTRSGS